MPWPTRRPTPSVKNRAVVPVPNPTSIPSWTSSSAFWAAACLSSAVKRVADRLDARGDAPLVAKHRAAGDQYRRPGGHDGRRRPGVDSTVDLHLDVGRQGPHAPDLLWAARYEFLSAESRLDRHHVDQVDVRQDLAQVFERRRGVDLPGGRGSDVAKR